MSLAANRSAILSDELAPHSEALPDLHKNNNKFWVEVWNLESQQELLHRSLRKQHRLAQEQETRTRNKAPMTDDPGREQFSPEDRRATGNLAPSIWQRGSGKGSSFRPAAVIGVK